MQMGALCALGDNGKEADEVKTLKGKLDNINEWLHTPTANEMDWNLLEHLRMLSSTVEN